MVRRFHRGPGARGRPAGLVLALVISSALPPEVTSQRTEFHGGRWWGMYCSAGIVFHISERYYDRTLDHRGVAQVIQDRKVDRVSEAPCGRPRRGQLNVQRSMAPLSAMGRRRLNMSRAAAHRVRLNAQERLACPTLADQLVAAFLPSTFVPGPGGPHDDQHHHLIALVQARG